MFAAGPSGGCGGGGGDSGRGQSERQLGAEQAGQRHKQLGPIGVRVVRGEGRRWEPLREAGRSSRPSPSSGTESSRARAPASEAAPQRGVSRPASTPAALQDPVRDDRQGVRDGRRRRGQHGGWRRAVARAHPRHAQDHLPGREVREKPDESLPRLRQAVLRHSVQQRALQQRELRPLAGRLGAHLGQLRD